MGLSVFLRIAALVALAAARGAAAGEPVFSEVEGFTISADDVEAAEGPGGRIAVLEGNVVLEREGGTLTGAHGIYRESAREAVLWGDVRGTEEGASVSADTLRYFRDPDIVVLTGNASYADTSGSVTARRITFYRAQSIAVCSGGAVALDADGSTELAAERIAYDFDRGEVRASGEPVVTTRTDDGAEDVTLRADVVELETGGNALRAFGQVGIVRKDARAGARVVTFHRDDETMLLEGDPYVDQEGDRLTGERIFASAPGGELSRVLVTGRARASYSIDPEAPGDEAERGTVSGDTLTMFFEAGEPILTLVRGNAKSEHALGDSGERNEVTAQDLTVLFSEGRIERAVFRGSATGTYRFVPEGARAGPEEPGAPAPAEPAAAEPGAAPVAAPPDTTGLERVDYGAEEISYYVQRNRIVLRQGARVEYKDIALGSDEIVFDPDTEVLSASGNPDLRQKGDRFVGQALSYDLDAESGAIEGGASAYEDGLYYGDLIAQDPDGALRVRGGVYTTCTAEKPHYHIAAHQMKIYLDDKVVARPIVLYLGSVPVLALPFYVFPIKQGRHSGFLIPQIEVGVSEGEGRFVRNFGYYWAPSDYWDATLWADYYEQTKWIAHLQTRYALRYTLSGSVDASFTEETQGSRRWDLGLTHRQEIGRNWTAGASGDFRSDATYAQDANQSIQESLNRSLHSQLWARGRWSGLSTGITLDRRENLDEESVTQLLPKIDVSGSQRPVLTAPEGAGGLRGWISKVSYSWDARVVNDRKHDEGETTVHQGLGLGLILRTSRKLLGWLNITPHGSLTQNWYDRDKAGEQYRSRLTYEAGASAGTTIYGTFFPAVGSLAAVRHIVEPSVTYSWVPDFEEYFDENGTDEFFAFSGFGSTPRAREAVNLSLVNKLQLKIGEGADLRKLDNFLRFSMSTAYDLRESAEPWSDLVSRVELRPGEAASVSWDARHDPYNGHVQNSSVTATVDLTGQAPEADEPWEDRIRGEAVSPVDELRQMVAERASADEPGRRPWDASVSFRYARGADSDDATYWVDGRLALSLTTKWRVNWSAHYDLEAQEIASQEYVIHRDLHCWEAQLVGRYYAEEWQYYLRINVKALPDIQVDRGVRSLNREVQ